MARAAPWGLRHNEVQGDERIMMQPALSNPALCIPGARNKAQSAVKGLLAAGVALLVVTTVGAASAASLPPETFADLAAKVTPAVVNISSTHHAKGPMDSDIPDFPKGSPFEQFFRNFRGHGQKGSQDVTALGSGFIIDSTGYVV